MKVLLIQASMGASFGKKYSSRACLEPYALAILAGLTPKKIKLVCVDDYFEEIPYQVKWDLVAISFATFQAKRAYEIADKFRSLGIITLGGGIHPTVCPEEAKEHFDSINIGEAEETWPAILLDVQNGKLKKNYRSKENTDLALVKVDRSIFKNKKYMALPFVQFSRGCLYNCDFCSVKSLGYKGVRYRPVSEVIKEIGNIRGNLFCFTDDNICSDINQLESLLEDLKKIKKKWVAQTTIHCSHNMELLEQMKDAGCIALLIGFESLNQDALKQMKKTWSQSSEYVRSVNNNRNAGIMTYGAFVFGYDEDCQNSIQQALDFAMDQKFFMANFNHLQPYPGSNLYKRLKKQNRLIYDKWWLDDKYQFGDVVFHPEKMRAHELAFRCAQARNYFHGFRQIFNRLKNPVNRRSLYNIFLYLITNIVSRIDIQKKENIRLGLHIQEKNKNNGLSFTRQK